MLDIRSLGLLDQPEKTDIVSCLRRSRDSFEFEQTILDRRDGESEHRLIFSSLHAATVD